MISPLYQGSGILAVNVRKVLSLHNEPDSFYRIEVGRIWGKIEGLEEMPVEALPFMPGRVIKNQDIPSIVGCNGLCRLIEKCLENIRIAVARLNSEELSCKGAYTS